MSNGPLSLSLILSFSILSFSLLVPIAPAQGSFLKSNGSSALLSLNEWQSGGCPVKYFIVQYRSDLNREWQALPQPIPGEQEKYLIKDLLMDTWYRLRVAAHNEAGTTEAEYTFSTAGADRGTLSQPGWSVKDEESSWVGVLLLPLLSTLTIVGCVGVVVFGFRRKPQREMMGTDTRNLN